MATQSMEPHKNVRLARMTTKKQVPPPPFGVKKTMKKDKKNKTQQEVIKVTNFSCR